MRERGVCCINSLFLQTFLNGGLYVLFVAFVFLINVLFEVLLVDSVAISIMEVVGTPAVC